MFYDTTNKDLNIGTNHVFNVSNIIINNKLNVIFPFFFHCFIGDLGVLFVMVYVVFVSVFVFNIISARLFY